MPPAFNLVRGRLHPGFAVGSFGKENPCVQERWGVVCESSTGLDQAAEGFPDAHDVGARMLQLGRVLQEAYRSLDGVDVGHFFSMRAVLMKSPQCS